MNTKIKDFFTNSDDLDRLVLRPLSHINMNWEIRWCNKNKEYIREEDTFASILNDLIDEFAKTVPPNKYHKNEDCLAEYVKEFLNWKITKINDKWIGEDYDAILEHGGFHDLNEANLVKAATGRINAAIKRNQYHFDEMEKSHQRMLAAVITIIIFHR